jgi:hypothetical protein
MAAVMTERDMGWKRIKRELAALDGAYTQVGLQQGDEHKSFGQAVAEIGAIHEFGAPGAGIPRRSWLSTALEKNVRSLRGLKTRLLNSIYEGKRSAVQALGLLGQVHEDQVKANIVDGEFAPLKPETIRRKGSSKPLIDTAQMRQSVRHVEVMTGGGP